MAGQSLPDDHVMTLPYMASQADQRRTSLSQLN